MSVARRMPGRRLATLVPVTLLAAGLLAGCDGTTGSAPTPHLSDAASPVSATADKGGTVATFHGDGGGPQDTAAFTVHGRKVQFAFTVQPNDVGPVPFLWSMFPQGAPVDPHPRASDSCASCDGPQTSDLGTVPAGSYYLHVLTSRPWTLTISEH